MSDSDRLIMIFNAARSQPAGSERDAFIADACGDDTELKTQVISLLDAEGRSGEFLKATPIDETKIEEELLRLKPEEAGERIGPYKLREQIGEGGFGVVWVAEQQVPVRRTVALKIIKLGMDTRDVVARFEQERQALAMMDHPNIAQVHDAGATEHGRPFFVMELVRGIKITDYCDQANLPMLERLELFIQVCHAVQHAHQKGIIHRDLKPSNILVTMHDGVAVPKIIDFGVAKATQGRIIEQTIYTQFQQMIGTPLYMSPEQAEMSGLDVDTRTDIYALGVLLYELLTGCTPFDAEALMKAGYDEMRRVIREQEPQKPSTALHTMAQDKLTAVAHHRGSEPPKLIHAIHGDLDWIVMKCLEKDRTRRYETANGLAADLKRHLTNEPVMARPPSKAYQFRKFVRRNKLAFVASLAVAGTLVLGVVMSTLQAVRARRAEKEQSELRTQAQLAQKASQKEAAKARVISDFFQKALSSVNPETPDYTVRELLDESSANIAKSLEDQPEAEAALRTTMGQAYRRLALDREALVQNERALELRRQVFGEQSELVAESLVEIAFIHHGLGRGVAYAQDALKSYLEGAPYAQDALKIFREGVPYAQDALKIYREKGTIGHPRLYALAALEVNLSALQRFEEVDALAAEAQSIASKSPDTEFPELAMILQGIAGNKNRQGKYAKAEELGKKALEMHRRLNGAEHPITAWAMVHLGVALRGSGKFAEAESVFRQALSIFQKYHPYEHISVNRARDNLTAIFIDTGNSAGLEKLAEDRISFATKQIERNEADAEAWMERALGHADAKSWKAALADCAKAIKLQGVARSKKRPSLVNRCLRVVEGAWAAAESEVAETISRLVVTKFRQAIQENSDNIDDREFETALSNLAGLLRRRGNIAEAEVICREEIALERKLSGDEHPLVASSLMRLAWVLSDSRRWSEAEAALREALEIRQTVLSPGHTDTIQAMSGLLDSCLKAGRASEAISLLADVSTRKTNDTFLAMQVAALQVWFAKEADHAAACQRLLKWAADAETPGDAERVVKLTCLRPIDDASMREATLALARRAVKDGHEDKGFLPWAQMALGMAEYRSGHYPAADEALATAAKTAPATGSRRSFVEGTASFYRAMSLFKRGRQAEARELLTAAEAKMKPLPADEKNPLVDGRSDHDDLILWLAFKEARALLNALPATKN